MVSTVTVIVIDFDVTTVQSPTEHSTRRIQFEHKFVDNLATTIMKFHCGLESGKFSKMNFHRKINIGKFID